MTAVYMPNLDHEVSRLAAAVKMLNKHGAGSGIGGELGFSLKETFGYEFLSNGHFSAVLVGPGGYCV